MPSELDRDRIAHAKRVTEVMLKLVKDALERAERDQREDVKRNNIGIAKKFLADIKWMLAAHKELRFNDLEKVELLTTEMERKLPPQK